MGSLSNKNIISILSKVSDECQKEITSNSKTFYGAGLASEGFAGGYKAALQDVILLLNGVIPNSRFFYSMKQLRGKND